jgi:hypothetical protein
MSKFGKHHVSRFPHPTYLSDMSPCDFWLFGMFKGILKDQEFSSSDETEEAIRRIWDDFTFKNI